MKYCNGYSCGCRSVNGHYLRERYQFYSNDPTRAYFNVFSPYLCWVAAKERGNVAAAGATQNEIFPHTLVVVGVAAPRVGCNTNHAAPARVKHSGVGVAVDSPRICDICGYAYGARVCILMWSCAVAAVSNAMYTINYVTLF